MRLSAVHSFRQTTTTTTTSQAAAWRRQGRHLEATPTTLSSSSSSSAVVKEPAALHTVQGIQCLQVKIHLPVVGEITILEATADAQEVLVNLALQEDEEAEHDKDDGADETSSSSSSLTHADPYGAVLWPAATGVARTLLENTDTWLAGQTVCELGAGTGLVSLAAAAGGAKRVVATDYEVIPLKLLEYAAQHLNVPQLTSSQWQAGDGATRLETQLLDLCRHDCSDKDNYMPLPADATVVVAADVMYEPRTGRALAHRVVQALQAGCRVLIGDSPGRAGRPAFLQELQCLGVRHATFLETPGWTVTGDRHELICGASSTTVSKDEPEQLMVALMELDPHIHCPVST